MVWRLARSGSTAHHGLVWQRPSSEISRQTTRGRKLAVVKKGGRRVVRPQRVPLSSKAHRGLGPTCGLGGLPACRLESGKFPLTAVGVDWREKTRAAP